ncbi:hypothetical protein Ccrd_014264 [Cynara cardunculus var. scolymus]|uniref:Uncharacterized protein n=1 Tax=Cynara cardunculus var. scolymus TaxID=59895 RepID=A0A103YDW4_CYNCS|nr:hypothetical protein Ccrd_014264 [Cynara cardunculus var. scolymus]
MLVDPRQKMMAANSVFDPSVMMLVSSPAIKLSLRCCGCNVYHKLVDNL